MEPSKIFELDLDQKTCSSGNRVSTISGLSFTIGRGEVVRFVTGDELATRGLVEVLSLENLGFFGYLRFLGYTVEGTNEQLAEMSARYATRFPVVDLSPEASCFSVLRQAAVDAGVIQGTRDDEVETLAADYDLSDALGKRVAELAPAQSQLLSAALVDMSLPELLVIDGSTPPYSAARIVLETVFRRLSTRSAVIVVETTPTTAWNFLTSAVRDINVTTHLPAPLMENEPTTRSRITARTATRLQNVL